MPNYFNARHKIAKYLLEIRDKPISADILDVLRQTRLVIESEGLKTTYPTLSFYCDWYVHGALERNPLAWNILYQINTLICNCPANPTQPINALLKLNELQSEAKTLFENQKPEASLFNDDNKWTSFLFVLLHELCGKPLRWPSDINSNRRARSLFTQMTSGPTLERSLYPRAFLLTHDSDGHEGSGFYWTIVLEDVPHDVIIRALLASTAP